MRVRVTYVHRRVTRRPVGVVALHSTIGQGTHDTLGALPLCRRPGEKRQQCEEGSGAHLQDPQVSQEPPAKIRRREDKGEQTHDSPDNKPASASIGTTRKILQGVLDFFRRKEPSPPHQITSSLPQLLLPRPLQGIFVTSYHSEDQQQQQHLQQLHQQQQQLHHQQIQLHQQQQQLHQEQQQLHQQQPLQQEKQQQQLHQRQEQQKLVPATSARLRGKASTEVLKNVADTTKKPPVLRRSRLSQGQKPVRVSYEEFLWFIELTELPEVEKFLKRDICYRYADKYLLAMAFTYFARAGLTREQYTKEYFFVALYLAHDMEEDEEDYKYELFPWALGPRWRKTYQSFLKVRDDLFFAIHCRAVVSKRGCDQIMEIQPDCWLWRRERPAYHGGAMRDYLRHPSDNGRPRGPDKSPLQCMSCLERECEKSDHSYIVILSDSTESGENYYVEPAVTTEHKDDEGSDSKHRDGDSGFETFLMDPNVDANASSFTSPDSKLEAKQ
ncbi:uncharacterized protein LOC126981452 [Eriocheir sinensis]|uniref:uncharacterized protein LOC126981452 n=1 Tax=Eriocheir sinensis TaxID=95602 RepID=UPI0021C6A4FF|nr:uncharacterized protein LOC126981452 [Eriocheir sinensis]